MFVYNSYFKFIEFLQYSLGSGRKNINLYFTMN